MSLSESDTNEAGHHVYNPSIQHFGLFLPCVYIR